MLPMISAMRCSFFEDAGGELFRRKVGDVFFRAWVLAVEVAAAGQQVGGGDFPGLTVFFSARSPVCLSPPFDAVFGHGMGAGRAAERAGPQGPPRQRRIELPVSRP